MPLNLPLVQAVRAHQCVLADTTDRLVRRTRVVAAVTQTSVTVGTDPAAAAVTLAAAAVAPVATSALAVVDQATSTQ